MRYRTSDSQLAAARHGSPDETSRAERLGRESAGLESRMLGEIEKILGPNGLLHQSGRAMRFSPYQYDYARRATSGFCRYDHVGKKAAINMLQAATGTGKTIGYLVPLMLYAAHTGERVAVSSCTRQLQRQIVERDAAMAAEWVEQITGISLKLASRVGVGNYVSPLACAKLADRMAEEDADLHDEAIEFLNVLQAWVEQRDAYGEAVHSGILDDFLSEMNLSSLPGGIPDSLIRLTYQSPQEELQRYRADVALSRDADVLVVNHALVVLNANRYASILDDLATRPIAVLVCDEADRLPRVAASLLGVDLYLHKLHRMVAEYAARFGNPNLAKGVGDLYAYVMSQQRGGANLLTLSSHEELSRLAVVARRSLIPLEKMVVERMGRGNVFGDDANLASMLEFADAANDLSEFCRAIGSNDNTAIVSWSPVRAFPSLRVCRSDAGSIISRMWAALQWEGRADAHGADSVPGLAPQSYLKAVLFTSATLATPGKTIPASFDEFSRSVGVIRHAGKIDGLPVHNVRTELFGQYEPAHFGKMSFVLADPRMESPTQHEELDREEPSFASRPAWLDYCADMIRAAHAAGPRCLVLTLSHKDTAELAARLRGTPGLVVQRPGLSLRSCLDEYKKSAKALLISPAAWEGVDLPGMVNQLVVTRIPFAPPDRAADEILAEHMRHKKYAPEKIRATLHGMRMADACRKMAQGLGRGLRSKSDKVTVWICDPRFPLPAGMQDSLDPVLMDALPHRVYPTIASCIPARFADDAFECAKLYLKDGTLYVPGTFEEPPCKLHFA